MIEEFKFVDYIKHRIAKAEHEPDSAFKTFIQEVSLMFPELEGPKVANGQEVLDRICFRFRHDPWKKASIGNLVNAYRSFCKYKEKENISIRRARNPFI